MENTEYQALVREATRLFLTVRADPKDPAKRNACREFAERSPDHSEILARVERVHTAAGQRPATPLWGWVLALVLFGLAGWTFYEPLRIMALADYRTMRAPVPFDLSSGDRTILDAGSAIVDMSDAETRHIEILRGAVFFDVQADDRPFVVDSGGISVRVVGTAFEVSALDATTLIAVTEGVVEVTSRTREWTLGAGDRLRLKDADALQDVIDLQAVAPWRQDQLIADGMTFGELAAIIDRRLPGPVLVPSDALANTVVSGGVSLQDPLNALRILAATEGARVLSVPRLGTIILSAR